MLHNVRVKFWRFSATAYPALARRGILAAAPEALGFYMPSSLLQARGVKVGKDSCLWGNRLLRLPMPTLSPWTWRLHGYQEPLRDPPRNEGVKRRKLVCAAPHRVTGVVPEGWPAQDRITGRRRGWRSHARRRSARAWKHPCVGAGHLREGARTLAPSGMTVPCSTPSRMTFSTVPLFCSSCGALFRSPSSSLTRSTS